MSAPRRLLRTVALALLLSFAIGIAIGTWLRCELERTPVHIG